MKFIYGGLLAYVLLSTSVNAANSNTLKVLGPQGVNLWKLQGAHPSSGAVHAAARAEGDYPERWFVQPLDHFNKSNTATFKQRYWVNDKHYKPRPGAPVIVLDGGETSGTDRLGYLDTGIVDILAKATGGVGVVLEHRYYGTSIPVPDFSTDNLRWLDNDQSAADSANFMAKIKFDGISEDLTAPSHPWIYYGGSYAGARAAHMAVLYPELTYGAIASSAVTHAALTNWEYMEVIRRYAPKDCSAALQGGIEVIDHLLDNKRTNPVIRGLFNLTGLAHDDDFASIIESPLEYWQSKVWGEFDDPTFDQFCVDLVKPVGLSAQASKLPFGHAKRQVKIAKDVSVDYSIVNYATWVKENVVSTCKSSQEDCFGTYNDAAYQNTGLDQDWRLWLFQVCTQWGYYTTAPPDPKYPRIISRRLTLEYESKICKQAYPPGKYFTVPNTPNLTAVNSLGDFGLARDRLAFIDGEVDPWRPDTPHSQFYAKNRKDTTLRPFKLIPGAVHHWDEWGLANFTAEPPEIQKIHKEMIGFVTAWLKDWKAPKV